jgi:iron complex transport system ATP-binding protein
MKLTVNELGFHYKNGRDIFSNLTLEYETPKIMCILGLNGTGKSTLLKCIAGENRSTAGEILIDGRPAASFRPRELAKKIAYIPQNHYPTFPFSVMDVVLMGRTSHIGYLSVPGQRDKDIALEKLEQLKILHLKDKAYTDISGGERQMVMIAAALAQEPELLLLDEPTAHLDFGNQYRFIKIAAELSEKGMGIIMTTHTPDHAQTLGGMTAILDSGRLKVYNDADEAITSERMEQLYGIPVTLVLIGENKYCLPGGMK